MKHLFWVIPLLFIATAVGAGLAVWYTSSQQFVTAEPQPVENIEPAEIDEPSDEIQKPIEQTGSISFFGVDDGIRADYASNPLVVAFDDDVLTLAYEDRTTSLKFAPQEKVKLIQSEDGVNFNEIERVSTEVPKPLGIKIADGLWRRYVFMPNKGGVYSTTSTDGETYTLDDHLVWEAHAEDATDASEFGVYTYFVDPQGGVTLLFNYNEDNGDIAVGRLYAEPESMGLEFTLVETHILEGTLESEMYADPYTIELADGRIMLIVMNQEDGTRPPKGRTGTIHAYLSSDYGENFEYYGQLVSYEDIDSYEVYSLNDPKIVQFSDGTIRVYVAAMVEDGESENFGELIDGKVEGFKWVLVSASGQL